MLSLAFFIYILPSENIVPTISVHAISCQEMEEFVIVPALTMFASSLLTFLYFQETKESLKPHYSENTMSFFHPAATSTVGRARVPPPVLPKGSQALDNSFNVGFYYFFSCFHYFSVWSLTAFICRMLKMNFDISNFSKSTCQNKSCHTFEFSCIASAAFTVSHDKDGPTLLSLQ